MAGRSKYTERDRAQIMVALAANDQNVKKTARETGFPENTVRRWKKEFDEGINMPRDNVIQKQVTNHIAAMERVRDKALALIEQRLDAGEGKLTELGTITGIMTDKIDRAHGLATQRVEHVHTLPSREELRDVLGPVVEAAIAAAGARETDLELVEVSEGTYALPPAE